jgi:hypothetical protein
MTGPAGDGALGQALGPATTDSPDDQPRRYVYGIVRADSLDLSVDGVGDAARAYTLEFGSLAAVVSDIDTREPDQSDENSRAHDAVLRAVLEHGDGRAVVPMQFGMVFEHDRAIENVLRSSRRAIEDALDEVDDMVELGVKLVAPADGFDEDEQAIVTDVVETLGVHAASAADGDLFSDRLLLNRSFLVPRERREAFDDAVDEVESRYPDLLVQYTGPWAPYSFVDIEVGVES